MKKLIVIIAFLSLALMGCSTPEPIEEAPSVPDKVYNGDGFTFIYPGKYTADNMGIWTEEGYEKHIYPPQECDTCQIPQVKVKSEVTDKTLEEYIVHDHDFGDSTLEQMEDMENISVEKVTIGTNDFIKARVAEMFAITGYYTINGNKVVALKVYFDDRDNEDMQKMLETLTVEEITEPAEESDRKSNQITFDSCGEADKYSSKAWFSDFSSQIGDADNVKIMCLSKGGDLIVAVYNPGSYCGRGQIFRYYAQEKSLQEADVLGEVNDCSAGFYDIGKREGNIIPVLASTGDAGCSFDTYFDYDFIKNTVKLVRGCGKCAEIIDGNEVMGPEKCTDY